MKKININKPLIGLVIFSIIVSLINSRFLTPLNLINVFRQTSINSIIAIGMTLVILTGGIDLSVGSILAVTGAIATILIQSGYNSILVIIITVFIGAFVGFINGIVISKLKLQPFIITLVSMSILRGITLVITDGKPIPIKSDFIFEKIGNGSFYIIPIPVIIMILSYIIINYFLKNNKFGRYIYSIGGNEEATKLSGINVVKYKTYVYILSGIFSTIAALILISRLSSSQPTAGTSYELDAIAAVVLGGTSLSGGLGTLTGTFVGALIIGVLSNALNLLNVSSYYQMIVKGLVIFVAVIIDRNTNK